YRRHMPETLRGLDPGRLERSCSAGDVIRFGRGAPGIERAEVFLTGRGFDLHRHDTYAVGITTAGVQSFRYRGARRICLPGQLHVLHPDELHDGGPATPAGFAYRILYVEPALIGEALGGAPLPFVAEPVHDVTPATRALAELLAAIDDPLDDLAATDAVATVAGALRGMAGPPAGAPDPILDRAALGRVREHLAACAREPVRAEALERISGL